MCFDGVPNIEYTSRKESSMIDRRSRMSQLMCCIFLYRNTKTNDSLYFIQTNLQDLAAEMMMINDLMILILIIESVMNH